MDLAKVKSKNTLITKCKVEFAVIRPGFMKGDKNVATFKNDTDRLLILDTILMDKAKGNSTVVCSENLKNLLLL